MRVSYLLSDAYNSLKKQSYNDPYLPGLDITKKSIKLRNPKINKDGYGIIFKKKNKFIIKKTKVSISNNDHILNNDINRLTKLKKTNFLMGFIRNNNFKSDHKNKNNDVQPYIYNNVFFMHNGGFNTHYDTIKQKLLKYIDPIYSNKIGINLDSKLLFSLLLSNINLSSYVSHDSIYNDLLKIIKIINLSKPNNFNISLNFILSDVISNTHIAVRYRTNDQIPPSLYYNISFRKGFIISSEPINMQKGWKLLKNNILILKNYKYRLYNIN